jgi:Aminotransferase class I and II
MSQGKSSIPTKKPSSGKPIQWLLSGAYIVGAMLGSPLSSRLHGSENKHIASPASLFLHQRAGMMRRRDLSTYCRLARMRLAAACTPALALLASVVFAASASAQSSEPIKIGYSMALTGGLAPNGKSALLAQKIWEEEVNAKGGLLRRPVNSSASVIYLGTFSKSIGAGLRIGYLAVPVELAETAIAIKAILNAGQSWLDQAVLADFISSGSFARHLNHVRSVYRLRRDCLLDALREHFGKVDVSGQQGGMHVMWHLPDSLPTATAVQATALNHGVGVYSLRSAVAFDFTQTPYSARSLVLGYPALTEEQIGEGIARVARALI